MEEESPGQNGIQFKVLSKKSHAQRIKNYSREVKRRDRLLKQRTHREEVMLVDKNGQLLFPFMKEHTEIVYAMGWSFKIGARPEGMTEAEWVKKTGRY